MSPLDRRWRALKICCNVDNGPVAQGTTEPGRPEHRTWTVLGNYKTARERLFFYRVVYRSSEIPFLANFDRFKYERFQSKSWTIIIVTETYTMLEHNNYSKRLYTLRTYTWKFKDLNWLKSRQLYCVSIHTFSDPVIINCFFTFSAYIEVVGMVYVRVFDLGSRVS